jgi:hypothetical protein
MKTITFTDRGAFYGCSEPGNNAGDYVRASEAIMYAERSRRAAQILIAQIGSVGPENADDAAERAVAEIKRLKGELVGIGKYASGHHSDEESCRWLHALTVDIPAMVEQITGEKISEPSGEWFPSDQLPAKAEGATE